MENFNQWAKNLSEYDSDTYCPLLGVSDEGSAANIIAQVAQTSSKMIAFNDNDINKVGIIIDGERMTSAGECPIGLEEYKVIVEAADSKTNCSTNVGVRLNTRYYQQYPEILLSDYVNDKTKLLDHILEIFKPYLQTPDGILRPLKVRINVNVEDSKKFLLSLLSDISKARLENKIGDDEIHRITLLIEFKDIISKEKHSDTLHKFINLTSELTIKELCIDGYIIEYGRRRLSSNGLLNIIEASFLNELIIEAKKKNVNLRYKYCIDIESAARTAWAGLHAAKSFGLNAGKYGLVPLILEEQLEVITCIQQWITDWTAIPAFYVDIPLLSKGGLYFGDSIKEGLLKWLEMVSKIGVNTVLIDCPDRIVRRRLLKTNDTDTVGVLSMSDIPDILNHANNLKIKVLWSGGITYSQAYEFGKLKVFGIFTTSTTAKRIAVGNVLIRDPVLPFEMEPTEKGIKLVHSLLQAGFLVSSLNNNSSEEIKLASNEILNLISPNGLDSVSDEILEYYMQKLVTGWKQLLNK
ncbi:hypothetical protein GXP67_00950 [Rhodocytophaga rosea]|uniref:Uncharacterized protein n=1 Tax=Rhodocytophaga rosea TaxID=2704465 RepID=A0A6C0GCD9_9BACT|nr:hypothetical protein [Rhodocytophaga rosea]QHT65340.1 hypothetical protein GXP67_00950 [Rhodocytophaga rosea]